ncbi:hypothetical protein H0O02_00415 [Candidatus Micrarchaeota archaeon]|nr:hypothetical protein [Candidatus Micrarchaeota archaeon]
MYGIEFDSAWDRYFEKLAPDIQKRIWKKILRIKDGLPGRHLHYGIDYFVEEVGQYRVCYKSFEVKKVRRLYFVGDHKEYEKWMRGL